MFHPLNGVINAAAAAAAAGGDNNDSNADGPSAYSTTTNSAADPTSSPPSSSSALPSDNNGGSSSSSPVLHFTYFALFDGHAGTGCALWAANTLHHHIREKLGEVSHLIAQLEESADGILTNGPTFPPFGGGVKKKKVRFESMNHVTADSLIQGALEKAFVLMDQQVGLTNAERNSKEI